MKLNQLVSIVIMITTSIPAIATQNLSAVDFCHSSQKFNFISKKQKEGGLSPRGQSEIKWQLSLHHTKVEWQHTDMVELGQVVCDKDDVSVHISGEIHPIQIINNTFVFKGDVYQLIH